jgi:lipopolysaccharide/colanic/teichoic acid biosynthesis glycosyltransferase
MTTYHFDYEAPRPNGRVPQAEPGRKATQAVRRAKGIVFADDTGPGAAFYYDLRTRHPIGARVKRAFDILFAATTILLISPLLLIIAALVKLTSPGPIIFRQRRIGFRCHQFDMYKFRTMVNGAHLLEKELAAKSGKAFLKLKRDPRITSIGGFLRKYSLDELPQLFNVLEGTMSIVGPRPLLVSDLDKLPRRSGLTRFSTPPGITGLWQVSGRSTCSDLKRLRLDRHYVEYWSLRMDFEILLRTVEVVITGADAV